MTTALSSETVHASTVAIDGYAVMICGRPGSGKSDLALRLIDRGATLVSDDYTIVARTGDMLVASAPETIKGRIEIRGLGLVEMPSVSGVPIAFMVVVDAPVPRMPEPDEKRVLAGLALPVIVLAPFEESTPIKVEIAMRQMARA